MSEQFFDLNFNPKDVANLKPTSVKIGVEYYDVVTWKEVADIIFQYMYNLDATLFETLIKVTKEKFLTRKVDKLREPVAIAETGIYFEGCFDDANLLDVMKKMVLMYDIMAKIDLTKKVWVYVS